VRDEEVAHDRLDASAARRFLPGVDRLAPAQQAQRVEAGAEGVDVADEELVFAQQQRDPRVLGQLEPDARRGAHAREQRGRHAQVADLGALAFDEHRARRIEPAQRVPDRGVERLLRRLRLARREAEDRAAVVGERLEVDTCSPRAPSARSSRLLPEPVTPPTTTKESLPGSVSSAATTARRKAWYPPSSTWTRKPICPSTRPSEPLRCPPRQQ
jgi:hypothetical protein